jgi:hypothetical protein
MQGEETPYAATLDRIGRVLANADKKGPEGPIDTRENPVVPGH